MDRGVIAIITGPRRVMVIEDETKTLDWQWMQLRASGKYGLLCSAHAATSA